jgi:hypothetical protein
MFFLRHSLILALGTAAVLAQNAPDPANPPGKPTVVELQAAAADAEKKLPAPDLSTQPYFQLSDARRDRLQKHLPRTLLKLTRRDRLHVLVIGDSSLQGADSSVDPLLQSFATEFAKKLAAQFYLTGGVRLVRADTGLQAKERPVFGPEIVLQPVIASSMTQAVAALQSEGSQGRPDLILLALGFEDGFNDTPLADVEASFRALLGAARARRIEVIVAGPMLQAEEPAEASLARTRGTTSLLREICAEEGLLFADLGDLSRLIATPASLTTAEQNFPVLARQYQLRLKAMPQGQIALADASLHESLGQLLFEDIFDGPTTVPWSVQLASSQAEGTDKLTLSIEVQNTAATNAKLTLLPLVTTTWLPRQVNPQISLPAGQSQSVSIDYKRTAGRADDMPARLPVLVISGGVSRIHDLVVPGAAPAIAWRSRTTFNHEGVFSPGLQILNSSREKLAGSWELDFRGQKSTGSLALEPDAAESPDLKLELALKPDSPFRQTVPLSLQIDVSGQKRVFSRQLEITRNAGLKQILPLSAADGQNTAATVQFDADGSKFFVTCDLAGLTLEDDVDTGRAFEAFLNLDARQYGQRLTPGATAAIRISGKAGDGPAQVDSLSSWSFGNGYAANYDVKDITAKVASTPDGKRTLTLTLPRAYLYDHEWALANGNSQLGVNFRLLAAGRSLFLTTSARHPDDAESLTVLELTDKPTLRATVRVE